MSNNYGNGQRRHEHNSDNQSRNQWQKKNNNRGKQSHTHILSERKRKSVSQVPPFATSLFVCNTDIRYTLPSFKFYYYGGTGVISK